MAAPGALSVYPCGAACGPLARTATDEVTLMLQGIACRLNQESMKQVLDALGLRGKFSFVCVPSAVSQKSNLGYAFVRFRSIEYAKECLNICHGKPFGPSAKGKLCQVTIAKNQADGERISKKQRRKRNGREDILLVCDDSVDPARAPQFVDAKTGTGQIDPLAGGGHSGARMSFAGEWSTSGASDFFEEEGEAVLADSVFLAMDAVSGHTSTSAQLEPMAVVVVAGGAGASREARAPMWRRGAARSSK